MFQIDLKSRQSIYEQVVENIKRLVFSGILEKDAKLPSVRELSKTLTVNPNTVQKAYRELERQGFIYTVSGKGCFVSAPEDRSVNEETKRTMFAEFKRLIEELLYLGVGENEIRSGLEAVFAEYERAGEAG